MTFQNIVNLKPLDYIQTSLADIPAVNPSEVFKRYRPLDRGNSKLDKGILSFSLPPVITCPIRCIGCYDVRSLRYRSVRAKRTLNLAMFLHNPSELERLIIKQVENSKTVKYIRIHVGGDFFSSAYVLFWTQLVAKVQAIKPHIKVYTYTKTSYAPTLKKAGINVVRSLLPDGSLNYGPLKAVKALRKEYGGIICPATLRKVPSHFCGSKCTACIDKEDVFFVIH